MIGVALLYLLEHAGFFAANGLLTEVLQKITKLGDVSLDSRGVLINDWRCLEHGI